MRRSKRVRMSRALKQRIERFLDYSIRTFETMGPD